MSRFVLAHVDHFAPKLFAVGVLPNLTMHMHVVLSILSICGVLLMLALHKMFAGMLSYVDNVY